MNGIFQKIYPHVLAGLLLAGVIGVWRMSIQVESLSNQMLQVIERIDKREQIVDRRMERIEDRIWRENSDP